MKISKTAVLIGGFLTTGLGLTIVSADKQIFVNPEYLVQHINNVKFISDEIETTAEIKDNNGLVEIDTEYNFVLSTGSYDNMISDGMNSSILGGTDNTISGDYSVILGGKKNKIESGTGNSILGGVENVIVDGENSVIIGGKENLLMGNNSSIVGGTGNSISGNYSVVVGNNSHVTGDNSVVMGQNSNLNASNSFLWTDGNNPREFGANNVFAVISSGGVVINATGPYNEYTQLTLGGPLVLSENIETNSGIVCKGGEGGGIVKVVNSGGKVCMCSCDGEGRSSLFGLGTCRSVCNSDIKPKCGTGISKHWDSTGNYNYYSGGCDSGNVVDGSYLVDKYNIVHWTCQSDDGAVLECTGSEINGEGKEGCGGEKPKGLNIEWGQSTGLSNNIRKQWTYKDEGDLGICEWRCKQYYRHDDETNTCVEIVNQCQKIENVPKSFVLTGRGTYTGNYRPNEWTGIDKYLFNKLGVNNACYWTCKVGVYRPDLGICEGGTLINSCGEGLPEGEGVEVNYSSDIPYFQNMPYKFEDYNVNGNSPCTFHCKDKYVYKEGINKCVKNKFPCDGKPGTGNYVYKGDSEYESGHSPTERKYIPSEELGEDELLACQWTCQQGCVKVNNSLVGETCVCTSAHCIAEDKIPKLNAHKNNYNPPVVDTEWYRSLQTDEPCTFSCDKYYSYDPVSNLCEREDSPTRGCGDEIYGCSGSVLDSSSMKSEFDSDRQKVKYSRKCLHEDFGPEGKDCFVYKDIKCKHCATNGFPYCFPIDFRDDCDEGGWRINN